MGAASRGVGGGGGLKNAMSRRGWGVTVVAVVALDRRTIGQSRGQVVRLSGWAAGRLNGWSGGQVIRLGD